MDSSAKAVLKHRAYEATKEFVVMALYLWIIFGLFELHRSVLLAQEHIPVVYKGFALINALVLAKIMLIAKELHLGERVNDAPLIVPTFVKSALFSVVLALFKILEEAARGLYNGRSFSQSIAEIGGGTWQGILSVTLLLFVLLIPFFGFTELQRVLGGGRLHEIFFRSRQPSEQPRSYS